MKFVCAALVMVAALIGFSSSAAATDEVITACRNPAGQLRLVAAASDCHSQEHVVVWNVEGPEGPQGPAGPEGPPGTSVPTPSPVSVLDATGNAVGHLVGRNGEALVTIGGEKFFGTLQKNGLVFGGRFLYQAAGCTDAPATNLHSAQALAPTALVTSTAAWVPDESVAPVTLTPPPGGFLTLHSRLIDANGGVGPCLPVLSPAITLWQLRPIEIGSIVPPLQLP
jgi:hypothetical protein